MIAYDNKSELKDITMDKKIPQQNSLFRQGWRFFCSQLSSNHV